MRFALFVCSFFILVIHNGSGAQYDFRPTPIPLTDWQDRRQGRASTLHETFWTEAPTAAAVPAHYWEDALRHSVYLTLVRDKIDQLIARSLSKEIDDHKLWEKIKAAPFDRIKAEEPSVVGDVTVMAKGRLLEENDGYRFTEDKSSCKEQHCMRGVKAVWSVKRVKQRDQEEGKYHYELTFSVTSQPPLKKRKPYETPVRTFTVWESPGPLVESNRAYDINRSPPPQHTPRPARAIWFHKNIVPQQQQTRRQHFGALDRIFSSLFSDDDERSYEPPAPKYKPNPYGQHAKVGYVGASSDQHQQVNPPHRYRPPQTNFGRPPYGPPSTIQQQQLHQYHQPQHQYQPPQQQYQSHQIPPQKSHQHFDATPPTTFNGHNYHTPNDRRVEPYSTVKSTRPAILPTPLPPLSSETTSAASYESLENVTNFTDFAPHTSNRFKPTSTKVSYFTDHVRPPVYNAPPGVFVTMDKKPFKPMPPLKLVHTKGHKNRPIDFRPSPQLHDHMIIDEDSFSDSVFRPINVAHNASSLSDEIETNKKPEHKHRKPTSQGKKPSKKHSSAKRVSSTATPDIITAQAVPEEDMDAIYWTNVLNSFTKTTPMSSQLEKDIVISTVGSTEDTSSLSTSSLEVIEKITTTPAVQLETTPAPTSPKPRKRTRPPPTFTKPEKVRKHKRITTTTTTTTNAPRITHRSTESPAVRKTDLTPQASSAPTAQRNKTTSTSTTTTSTSSTTTTKAPTTTTSKPPTTTRPATTTERKTSTTTLPRNRNRFRQSTLIIKGTSLKHDRWSVIGIQKNNTTPSAPSAASLSYRRKGSNFQGYSSTTPRNVEKEAPSTQTNGVETSTNYDTYESNSVIPLERSEESDFDEDDEATTSSDESDSEYYSETTTWASDKTNEVTSDNEEATPATGTSTASQPLKKCKKKKSNSEADSNNDTATTAQPTTSEKSTDDILSEILKFNFDNDIGNGTKSRSDLVGEASINHGSYEKMDDHLKDFFDIMNDRPDETGPEAPFDDHFGDDDKEFEDVEDRDDDSEDGDDDSYDLDDSTTASTRQSKSKTEKPFSFLDLLV